MWGLYGALRGSSVVHVERELRKQRALVRLARGVHVHRHRGPGGSHRGRSKRWWSASAAMAAAATGAIAAAVDDRGGARSVL